ncbi:hypothetical protein FB451DRAFT_1169174 [Mycena latifolia]|nr:hypothetical protein FB451DRAFT_1169174 [Mycena latifolia]
MKFNARVSVDLVGFAALASTAPAPEITVTIRGGQEATAYIGYPVSLLYSFLRNIRRGLFFFIAARVAILVAGIKIPHLSKELVKTSAGEQAVPVGWPVTLIAARAWNAGLVGASTVTVCQREVPGLIGTNMPLGPVSCLFRY